MSCIFDLTFTAAIVIMVVGLSSPIGNLKGFASSRPPLVVFTLCLTAFAITTLSLAYFIKHTEYIPNPDVHLDWNKFLTKVAEVDLCVSYDENPDMYLLRQPRAVLNNSRGREETDTTSFTSTTDMTFSTLSEADLRDPVGNVSISVHASWSLVHELNNLPHNMTTISGVLDATQLKLNGDSSEKYLNVTFHLPGIQNLSQFQEICVTFVGPKSLLPVTKSPPACLPSGVPTSGAKFEGRSQTVEVLGDSDWCRDGSVMRMVYRPDPELAVLLTIRDRSLINLHLMHTSYFLFVMAMTLVCYALIRGKPKPKQISIEKVPLDP